MISKKSSDSLKFPKEKILDFVMRHHKYLSIRNFKLNDELLDIYPLGITLATTAGDTIQKERHYVEYYEDRENNRHGRC